MSPCLVIISPKCPEDPGDRRWVSKVALSWCERSRGLLFSSDEFTLSCFGRALGRLGYGIALELYLVELLVRSRHETT